jgi:endonuclease/exonuclease/phosphatase family metal-dependent hydrolase
MLDTVGALSRRCLVKTLAAVLGSTLLFGGSAAAQTTVVLNQSGSQVTDTTIRNGAYANTNYDGDPLITRRSSDPDWERRALIKFDTDSFLPTGAQISSATLTVTVKSGLGSGGRPIRVRQVTAGFLEAEATWRTRMGSTAWATPGGDTGEDVGSASATNVAGSKVTLNVTDLVQRTSNGDFGSRYTRLLLDDTGTDSKDSYREYYSSEDSTVSRRPTLTIVLASGAVPPPVSGGSTLKVMQWNIHQGYGADGKPNIDRVVDLIASKSPDIISFNEIMRYSSSSQPQMIADGLRARTGKTWTYKWVQKSGATSGEGECIMTHLAVDATDDYLLSASRSVAMIRVNVNGRIISAFSTHLDPTVGSTQMTQLQQVVGWTDNYAEQRIVAGDFNFWNTTSQYTEMSKTHNDGWVAARNKGTAFSYSGNPDGNTKNTRIDYVWYSKGATALVVTRAEVYYTKTTISDHNAVMVTFQVK